MEYSRVEAKPPHPFTKVAEVALEDEDVVNSIDPIQPNPGINESSGVRSDRPMGVKNADNKNVNVF